MDSVTSPRFVIGYDFGRQHNHVVYCRIEVCPQLSVGYQISDWGVLDFPHSTLSQITCQLYQCGQTRHAAVCGDWFVLETQPPGNGRCMVISHVWQAILLGLHCEPHKITFAHARAKFTVLDKAATFLPVQQESAKSATSKYRQRKKWAIAITADLLRHQPQRFQDLFEALTKKDDFSDAFLYAVAFIVKNKLKG